jgi:hypothetical protein
MSKANDPDKVVNANENLRHSWVTEYPDYAQYVPLANWLIQKYCTLWWKNHPESYEHRYCQFGICMELNGSRGSKDWTLTFIADRLKCNPVLLINDTSPELKDVK